MDETPISQSFAILQYMGRRFWAGVAFAGLALLAACGGDAADNGPSISVTSPDPTATATRPPPTPTPHPSPTPTPETNCEARAQAAAGLLAAVEATMAEYPGTWGFAFIDIECDATVSTDPAYRQYAASAGKIISIVAVLRGVEDGRIAGIDVEDAIVTILHTSDDLFSDYIESFITAEDLNQVIADAGVADSTIRESWRYTNFSAVDLARVWAALVDGRLLSAEWTEWVMARSGEADIPPPYETFPGGSAFEHPYLQYGQKAGYYVSDGVPYFLVGAGFLRDPESLQAFVPVVIMRTEFVDLNDLQRRTIFPLVLEHVEAALGRAE